MFTSIPTYACTIDKSNVTTTQLDELKELFSHLADYYAKEYYVHDRPDSVLLIAHFETLPKVSTFRRTLDADSTR